MVSPWRTLFAYSSGPGHYATVGSRIAAGVLDLIPFLPLAAVGLFFQDAWKDRAWVWLWSGGILALHSAYFVVFHARWGATPGKALLKCRLVGRDGNSCPTLRQAIIREVPWITLGVVSLLGLPSPWNAIDFAWFGACLVCMLVDPRRRNLDDIAAGLTLIQVERTASAAPTPTATLRGLRDALPLRRTAAAGLNLLLILGVKFGLLQWQNPGTPIDATLTGSAWQAGLAGLISFWLLCGMAGRSPGAMLLGIVTLDRDDRALAMLPSLLRSLPFLLFALYVGFIRQFDPGMVAQLTFSALWCFLAANGVVFTLTGRSLLDRMMKVRVMEQANPLDYR